MCALVWRPVFASFTLHVALMALYVGKHHGDPSILACVGSNRAGKPPYEAVTTVGGPNGYDGQFYYVIARAPWQRHPQGIQGIDMPGARQLRIFYPAVCWLFSGGDPRLLFWVMPAVNLAALCLLAWLGAVTAIRFRLSPWWGFFLPLAINAGMPALHDLTDTISMLALFGLLGGWLLGSHWMVLGVWAVIAVLSREQNLVVVSMVLLAAVVRRQVGATLAMAAALALWAGWVCCLRLAYGEWPFLPAQNNFASPLQGMLFRWTHPGGNLGFSRRLAVIQCTGLVQLTLEIGLGLYLTTWPASRLIKLCMVAGIALACVGGTYIYGDFYSYTRVFAWLPLGIWFTALQHGRRGPLLLLAPTFLSYLAAALGFV
jgi:hypothetical protein